MASIDSVPDEIIRQILYYVSPEDSFENIQLVSQRFLRLANDALLWKYYCLSSFRYWRRSHNLEAKLALRASQTAWKQLWVLRKRQNLEISQLLDHVIKTKVGRLQMIARICRFGYDAKDFLLEQCKAVPSADDALARRYFADNALASIHRSIAVKEWAQYQRDPLVAHGLDRALAAFDMFFVGGEDGDIDDICATLDRIAASFLRELDSPYELSPRAKALTLLRWVRDRNLVGMDDHKEDYNNLRNCLIGHALRDERQPSLPIISAAIYASLGERVGLRAVCCAIPSHAHAMVLAPAGQDLDGRPCSAPAEGADRMFLDPYGSSEEVKLDDMRSRLVELEWIHGREALLAAAPVPVVAQRVARSLAVTFGTFLNTGRQDLACLYSRPATRLTMESAAYAARWTNLLMTPVTNSQWDSTLDQFLNQVAQQFPEDGWIVEEYILPLYTIHTHTIHPRTRFTWENVPEMLGIIRNMDDRQPTVNRRYTQEIHRNVWYSVGQVFRHKRYGYIGIINGWGERGTQSLPMPHNMSFEEAMDDDLEDSGRDSDTIRRRLRKKTFYTCLKFDHDRHVVAQDRIEIVRDPGLIPAALMQMAGKFFRRFDPKTCRFVSNIKEYFPDD